MKLREIVETLKSNIWPPPDDHGNIDVSYMAITSLQGIPKRVEGAFDCAATAITTLEGGPEYVGGSFRCISTEITSYKGAPRYVGGTFLGGYNPLVSIEGAPAVVGGDFYCNDLTVKSFSLHNCHRYIKQIGAATPSSNNSVTFWFHQKAYLCTHILGLCLIQGIKRIHSGSTKIDNIFKECCPDVNLFQEALIEAGFTEQAKI